MRKTARGQRLLVWFLSLAMILICIPLTRQGVRAETPKGEIVCRTRYAYDCQRTTLFPKENDTVSLWSFTRPLRGYEVNGDKAGDWKIIKKGPYQKSYEDKGYYSTRTLVNNIANAYGNGSSKIEVYELLDGETHICYGVLCATFTQGYFFIGTTWQGGGAYILCDNELSSYDRITGVVKSDCAPSKNPTTSPETAVTIEPAETLVPLETLESVETLEPAETLEPVVTLEPAETLEPVVTLEPAVTLEPVETPESNVIIEPSHTPEPTISYTAKTMPTTFIYGTAATDSELGTVVATNFTGEVSYTAKVNNGNTGTAEEVTGKGITASVSEGKLKVTTSKDTPAGTFYIRVTGTNASKSVSTGYIPIVVNKKPVTANVSAENKIYDRTTTATISASISNDELVVGDTITISCLTGAFSDANAGNGKRVTVDSSNKSITGNGFENYEVTIPKYTTANITKATPSLATKPTAANRVIKAGSDEKLITA